MKADKLHVPEKGAGALSDALAEKFRIRNEKEVLGMAALATDIGLNYGEALGELRLETQKPREADSPVPTGRCRPSSGSTSSKRCSTSPTMKLWNN